MWSVTLRVILLDFFGTMVDYNPSRTEQGYGRSHQLVRAMGSDVSYARFLQVWSAESERLDARSAADDSEYSMAEVGRAVLARLLGRRPGDDEVADLVEVSVDEWNTGVTYPSWCRPTVERLASSYRLAVVTNTHLPSLVPAHLAAMGIADLIEAVVTSVELGWRKPHPAIYAQALARMECGPRDAVFVGEDQVMARQPWGQAGVVLRSARRCQTSGRNSPSIVGISSDTVGWIGTLRWSRV